MSSIPNIHFDQRLECPVCQSTDFKSLYKASYSDTEIKDYLND